jgi:predicted nucleic acid-binding protein
MRASGRTSRARLADLLIASTAAANDLALYRRNPNDFAGLERLVGVKAV